MPSDLRHVTGRLVDDEQYDARVDKLSNVKTEDLGLEALGKCGEAGEAQKGFDGEGDG